MTPAIMLLMSLLLYQAPLAELVSEGNSLESTYCITECDAPSITLQDKEMRFGTDRSCLLSYTNTASSDGTMTLVFGCDVPDGTGMTLEYVSYGTIHTVKGEFKDSECTMELGDMKNRSITEIYGNVEYDGNRDLEMTVYSVDKEGNRSYTWCD